MFDRHFKSWPEDRPRTLTFHNTRVDANLTATATRQPDKTALYYYDSPMTWQALDQAVDALAGYLHDRLGVCASDRVLLYMQNSPQYVIAYYAILRANAVVVPVNPMNRSDELDHLLIDTGASTVITSDELLRFLLPPQTSTSLTHVLVATYKDYLTTPTDLELPDVVANPPAHPEITGANNDSERPINLIAWRDALNEKLTPPVAGTDANDWCVIPYTSGTTGRPKGCLHKHYGVNAVILSYAHWMEMTSESVCLVSLPMFHVTGMQNSMNFPIFVGTTMIIMTRWNRVTAATLLQRYKVTHWRSITTMAIDFLSDPELQSVDLSTLVSIGGGGAQMPAALADALYERTGLHYIEGYGLSETISATHVNPPHEARPQCLGIPWFNVDSRVIDPQTCELLESNQTGEIVVHGAQVFSGYWQQPEATAQASIEIDGKTFLRTGDLGYFDDDGFFYMVDRLKRMINASGYKVWPAEVEAMMHAHPDIESACIIGAKHPHRGETVKAMIVLTNEADATMFQNNPALVVAWCEQRMAAYKVPRLIEFVSSLPVSGAGKVLWRELQAAQDIKDQQQADDPSSK